MVRRVGLGCGGCSRWLAVGRTLQVDGAVKVKKEWKRSGCLVTGEVVRSKVAGQGEARVRAAQTNFCQAVCSCRFKLHRSNTGQG